MQLALENVWNKLFTPRFSSAFVVHSACGSGNARCSDFEDGDDGVIHNLTGVISLPCKNSYDFQLEWSLPTSPAPEYIFAFHASIRFTVQSIGLFPPFIPPKQMDITEWKVGKSAFQRSYLENSSWCYWASPLVFSGLLLMILILESTDWHRLSKCIKQFYCLVTLESRSICRLSRMSRMHACVISPPNQSAWLNDIMHDVEIQFFFFFLSGCFLVQQDSRCVVKAWPFDLTTCPFPFQIGHSRHVSGRLKFDDGPANTDSGLTILGMALEVKDRKL